MSQEFTRPSHEQVHPAGVEVKGRQPSYAELHDLNAARTPQVDNEDAVRGLPAGAHIESDGVISNEHSQHTRSGKKVEPES